MTDKEIKKFYNSAAWQQRRLKILERDHYECQDCKRRLQEAGRKGKRLYGWQAKIGRATEVHHIKELKEQPELALDINNLTSLCRRCHNIRHGRNPFQFKKKKPKVSTEKW